MTRAAAGTQRYRQAEQALAASEERFRLLAEHARDGIYRICLRPDFAYEYVNPALVDITGASPESLYGDPDLPLRRIHTDDRALVRASRTDPDATDWPLEIRWDRDGSWRYLSVTEVPLHDDAGHVVAIQGYVVDVTDERQRHAALEETLRREQVAVERLREIDTLKKAFLQAVSHELRTPLTSIMSYTQTLHSRDAELAPETRHRLLGRLDHNAKRLARLLEDLLDLDRLQGGAVKLHRSHTDLTKVVLNVAGEHHSPDRPIDVLPHGDVTVGVDSLDRASPGTGSGLTLAREHARLHGGEAWATQRPGGGTRMHVDLRVPDRSPEPASGDGPALARPRAPQTHRSSASRSRSRRVSERRSVASRPGRARNGRPMEHADTRSDPRWDLLASSVRTRMIELDLSQRDLAA